MIVVIGGIKGGSGKTTIATNLTVIRSIEGKKVLLVDADEQKSASSWVEQRLNLARAMPEFITDSLAGKSLHVQLAKMRQDYDDIIVDVGGRDTTTQRSALVVADVYVVPFQPRSLDIWTLGSVQSLITECCVINPNLKCYALINRGDPLGNDNQEATNIIKECSNLTCLPINIGQRKAFANAATAGLGVTELKTPDRKAIAEIEQLYELIYQKSIKSIGDGCETDVNSMEK